MHTNLSRVLSLGLAALLLTSIFMVIIPIRAQNPEQDEIADWTFMVYLDADNNLEGAGIEDIQEMKTVGSTKDVNIVVLMDRAEGYDTTKGDWTGAKKFRVTKDLDLGANDSEEMIDMGEPNMGDPQTLIDFVTWAADEYPAEHYFLDLWDHGAAFIGACFDDGAENDDSDDDWLDMYNISEALHGIKEHLGRNIDVVGYDACLMSCVSVFYSMMDYCDIAIGSGPTEPGDGWPYERILAPLAAEPEMSPAELSEVVVDEYIRSYTDMNEDPNDALKVTLAAYDMHEFPAVVKATEKFGMALATTAGWPPSGQAVQLNAVRAATHSYDMAAFAGIDLAAIYPMYDLHELATNIVRDKLIFNDMLVEAAKEVRTAVEAAAIAVGVAHGEAHPNVYSLGIYYPTGDRLPGEIDPLPGPGSPYDSNYDKTPWAQELFWDDYLKNYWANHQSASNTPPSVFISQEEGGEGKTDKTVREVSGSVVELQSTPKVLISTDGENWDEAEVKAKGKGEYHWEYEIPENVGGRKTVMIKARDNEGKESVSRSIEIDLPEVKKEKDQGPDLLPIIGGIIIVLAVLVSVFYIRRKQSMEAEEEELEEREETEEEED